MEEENPSVKVDEQELDRVRDILRTLAVAVKTFTIYPKDNPIYQKFANELFERFNTFFESGEELPVEVEQHTMIYKGNKVFHSEERTDNIALLLFVDGIREIDFYKGISFEEIIDFIDILRYAARPEAGDDDDIVTLLWEKNIKNMGYTTVEDRVDDWLAVEEIFLSEGVEQKAVEEAAVDGSLVAQPSVILFPELLQEKPMPVTKLAALDPQFSGIEEASLLSSTVGLFFTLLSDETNADAFPEIVQGLGRIMEIRIRNRDIQGTVEILTYLREISTIYHDAGQSRQIASVVRKAGVPESLRKVFSESPEGGIIRQYLFLLGKDSIPDMIHLLGELQEMKQRKLMCEVLAELGGENTDVFSETLDDGRWYLVRNIATILGMTRDPSAVRHLGKLLGHPNMKVRREALKALEGIDSEETKNLFLVALRDEDPGIRLRALRVLRRYKDPGVFAALREIASSDDLRKKALEEKKGVLEALAVVGGGEAFPLLADLFRRRGLLEKEEVTELRACAAYGLGLLKTPEARALIEKERGSRKDVLREACIRALREPAANGNTGK